MYLFALVKVTSVEDNNFRDRIIEVLENNEINTEAFGKKAEVETEFQRKKRH